MKIVTFIIKTAKYLLLTFLIFIGIVYIMGAYVFSSPPYIGPISPHFDGKQFKNRLPRPQLKKGFWQRITDFSRKEPWPPYFEIKQGQVKNREEGDSRIYVTFINHSTFLMQFPGLNILTDPIYSDRCSPVSFIGPKRRHKPGLAFEDLPNIDLILLSHNHYDHMDLPTLQRLQEKFNPKILTPLGNSAFLKKSAIENSLDMDWWDSQKIKEYQVYCVPARHFSSRGLGDRDKNLWSGFYVKAPDLSIYFAADTGFDQEIFADIQKNCGSPDISILPIGAYLPYDFMGPVHLSPKDALQAHDILQSKFSMACHFECFPLAWDRLDQPRQEMAKLLKKREEQGIFFLPYPGETHIYDAKSNDFFCD